MKSLKATALLILICLTVFFSACSKDAGKSNSENTKEPAVTYTAGETVVIADSEGCDYTIVRPDNCADAVTNAAVSLRKAIMGIIGDMPALKTDYGTKITNEILIGSTNRSVSEKATDGLGEKDYRITFSGTKIVIVGGSDAATAEAVEYFIASYVKDGKLSVIYGEDHLHTYVPPQIMIDGTDLTEFKIYSDGAPQSLVTRITDAISAAIGTTLETTNERSGKYIELTANEELETGYYMAKLQNDGNIHLQSDTATGLYYSVSCFEKAIQNMNEPGVVYSLALSDSGAYPPAFEGFSADDSHYFLCETNKDALSYEIGEEIEFTVSLFANGELASCARFDWTLQGDDGKTSSGSADGITGILNLKTTLDNNGFVMLVVKAIGPDGNEIDKDIRFSGAAGVHPELLTITKEEPEDFDAYWAEAINEMMAVEPEIIEMEEIEGQSGYKTYKMKLACAGNTKWTGETYVSGYLTYPVDAAAKSLKIRASFQGYGVNSPSPSYSGSYISFSVCGHSIEIGQEKSYYSDLQNNELKSHGWSTAENADPKNVYFRYMLLRDLQALRFMKEYFGGNGNNLWDGETITLSGSSQGGFQVIALAALDKDIDSISAGVPWMCDIGGYLDGKKIKSSFRPDFADGLGYFDSASFAKRVTCNVSISAGLGDPLCPPAGVAVMYNALTCPKTLTFGQNKTHSYNPPAGDKFTFSEG